MNSVHRGGLQAHTQGEGWGSGWGGPGPHPGGEVGGSGRGGLQAHTWGVSRPTPGGLQAHTWGSPGPGLGSIPACTEADTTTLPLLAADDYCCKQYASYWNAFLFSNVSMNNRQNETSLIPLISPSPLTQC